jgi:hypothetical protein
MGLAIRSTKAYDPKIESLGTSIRRLDAKFAELQTEHSRIQTEHSQKCTDALGASLSHLAKVIEDVSIADKKLIYWYEQKRGVKLMLRCVGIDKRTSAIVGRKIKQLKGDITKTEKKFRRTSEAFSAGMTAVQGLNTRVTSYTLLEVGEVHNSSTSALKDFSDELEEVETTTRHKRLEHVHVEEQVQEVCVDITRTEASRGIAADGSETCENVCTTSLTLKYEAKLNLLKLACCCRLYRCRFLWSSRIILSISLGCSACRCYLRHCQCHRVEHVGHTSQKSPSPWRSIASSAWRSSRADPRS